MPYKILRFTHGFDNVDDATLRPHAQAIIRQLRCAGGKRPTPSETPDTSTVAEEPKAKKLHAHRSNNLIEANI